MNTTPEDAAQMSPSLSGGGKRAVRKHFGTDGVRGIANTELSPLRAMALGAAAALALLSQAADGERHEVIVGGDGRISGDLLESALTAGLLSQGVDVVSVGVVPTPGVAFITKARGAAAGVVISASHNPVQDNGIKFFGPDGKKLPDATEARIEAAMDNWESAPRPTGAHVGRLFRSTEPVAGYAAHLAASCEGRLDGLRLVIDCANGAASYLAKDVLERMGATVDAMASDPNGVNINHNCGSLHPEAMAQRVAELGFDAGAAFDGDADRVILADEKGRVFDGDRIMYALGVALQSQNKLVNNVVVGTTMSNMGLEKALAAVGIEFLRAPVGDRYVTEKMRDSGAVLGGEKSGHILLPGVSTTGDGLLTAIQVLCLLHQSGRKLSEWADAVTEYPQRLVSVKVREREGWENVPAIARAKADAEARLDGRGRINVRPSGTEKLIRVMVEGPDEAEVNAIADAVAGAIREQLGA